MEALNHYDRILDGKYGILNAFNPQKDKKGLSVVRGIDLLTNEIVAIKIMDTSFEKTREFEEEVLKNMLLPDGEVRLIKMKTAVRARDVMPEYPLLGDGSTLRRYNYMVMPMMERGTLLDLILKVNKSTS